MPASPLSYRPVDILGRWRVRNIWQSASLTIFKCHFFLVMMGFLHWSRPVYKSTLLIMHFWVNTFVFEFCLIQQRMIFIQSAGENYMWLASQTGSICINRGLPDCDLLSWTVDGTTAGIRRRSKRACKRFVSNSHIYWCHLLLFAAKTI